MLPTTKVQFATRKEALEYIHWEKVIEHILAKEDISTVETIIVCPQPSILTLNRQSDQFRIIGSHPEELSYFFETHSPGLIAGSKSVHLHLIDVPQRTCTNVWQRLSFLKQSKKQGTQLRTIDMTLYIAQIEWLQKHPIEKIHALQKSVPVHLLPKVCTPQTFCIINITVNKEKYERTVTYVQMQFLEASSAIGDFSGYADFPVAESYKFVQVCLPKLFLTDNHAARDRLRNFDSLRVAPSRYIGLKDHDPKEYFFQAFRFKQDILYWRSLLTELHGFVAMASNFGPHATCYHFDHEIPDLAHVRLRTSTFPEFALMLQQYQFLKLDATHTLYSLPNLAYEKAVQACVLQSIRSDILKMFVKEFVNLAQQ